MLVRYTLSDYIGEAIAFSKLGGDENDWVRPTQPPTGASAFANIRYAPLTGHYYKLEQGRPLPPGITAIADGRDVGGTHSSTHYTIYPRQEMLFPEFVSKFLDCGWVYVGKKELR